MKKLIWAPVLISLAMSAACSKKSSNSGTTAAVAPATTCTQNVTYDQYGRPIQSCLNTVPTNGQVNPYTYPPYGNNNGFNGNVGMTGNPCATLMAQWQTYYVPRFIGGQWWCVQPGYQGMPY
jgi:hypothetical protein